jgi:two-component system LytT family response regulator
MPIKCIIIDDEAHGIITLEHHLKKIKDIVIVATTQDSTHAKDLILEHQPDIVFLDIEMPKLNGFQVLEQFDEINFKIIITTAYDQYAIKALKYNAMDYLLKPIDMEELENAINKYHKNELQNSKEQVLQVQKFRSTMMQDIIALSMQDGLIFVKIADIAYLEASGNYTHITLQNGTKHVTSKSLAVFEDVLKDHPIFFRAHKSYIVNLRYIKLFNRKDGGEIIMQDDKSILLSRNKKQEFWDLFQKI